jgi:DNA-binding phage protein
MTRTAEAQSVRAQSIMDGLRDRIMRTVASDGQADAARLHAILELLTVQRGMLHSAEAVARASGFASRHQLHRFLKSRGLPSVRTLSAWVRVALLTDSAQPLEDIAWSEGIDPSVDHRRLRRLTGMTCRTARQSDVDSVLRRLGDSGDGGRWGSSYPQPRSSDWRRTPPTHLPEPPMR